MLYAPQLLVDGTRIAELLDPVCKEEGTFELAKCILQSPSLAVAADPNAKMLPLR